MIIETTPSLIGTWPVRMHSDRFFGTLQSDGQHPRVAAIVCYGGDVVALSLVGYDTSVSAALASIFLRESVAFLPDVGVRWNGPRVLHRRPESYKQFSIQLESTREVQCVALPASANIAEGILHPPDLPTPSEEKTSIVKFTEDRTCFVLGNWDEDTPHERSFLGTLYGMRVLFLHRDKDHPEWPHVWAREIWARGLVRKLIQPLNEALGMKAWMLSDDLVAWSHLIGDGVREGWLPWNTSQEASPVQEGAGIQTYTVRDALAFSSR